MTGPQPALPGMEQPTDTMIVTAEQAEALPVGQWVIDADGTARCLVDTNVGWPQRMWMNEGGTVNIAIDGVPYPLQFADVDDVCPHSWGTQECGHCRRCGAVVEPPRHLEWNFLGIQVP